MDPGMKTLRIRWSQLPKQWSADWFISCSLWPDSHNSLLNHDDISRDSNLVVCSSVLTVLHYCKANQRLHPRSVPCPAALSKPMCHRSCSWAFILLLHDEEGHRRKVAGENIWKKSIFQDQRAPCVAQRVLRVLLRANKQFSGWVTAIFFSCQKPICVAKSSMKRDGERRENEIKGGKKNPLKTLHINKKNCKIIIIFSYI